MRQPELYTANQLRSWNNATQTLDGLYVPARPEGHNLYPFLHRVKLALRVFRGECDAVAWDYALAEYKGEEDTTLTLCAARVQRWYQREAERQHQEGSYIGCDPATPGGDYTVLHHPRLNEYRNLPSNPQTCQTCQNCNN